MAAKKDLPMLPAEQLAPRADCSWEACRQKAVVCEEIEYGKGRHNLCEYHWVEAHKLRAKKWCESKGLFTIEQKRDYCRNLMHGTLLKAMPNDARQPGQDDEERIAA